MKKIYLLMASALLMAVACKGPVSPQDRLTVNDAKIDKIIAQMTLEEKVNMLHSKTNMSSAGVERLGIAEMNYADGPFGIREEGQPNGSMPADEVVQLYVSRPESKVEWPVKELKAFSRVSLQPGETKTVSLLIPMKELRYWNEELGAWDLEHGTLQLLAGSASDDIRLTGEVTI